MSEKTIEWQVAGKLARLTLARTAKRNALRLADWHAFAGALDSIAASGAQALIVRSADARVFSAGSDLKELAGLADDAAARLPFAEAMDAVMQRLSRGPMVTIAEIEGAAHGAGVAIAMACDIRVAGPASSFAIPPARFGISYPASDIARLVRLVGAGQAARLLYSAEGIDAADALRIGLVEEVAEDAAARAGSLAQAVAANSATSLALLRRALAASDAVVPVAPDRDAQFLEGFASGDFRAFVSR